MRIFHFFRHEDASGVSGTGVVAEGVEFTNGWCAVRWLSSKSSLCFYQTLEEVRNIHGHGGRTEVVLNEITPVRPKNIQFGDNRQEVLMNLLDEVASMLALAEEADSPMESYCALISSARIRLDSLENNLKRSRPSS